MGFVTATAMLIGTVIGASVFIVPGALAASAGPAVWLTYLIGAILILFAAVMFAQIGSVMPVTAANYRLTASTVNGTWGFLYIWVFGIANIFLVPIMALTAAEYLGVFHPSLNSMPVAVGLVVITGLVNILGLRAAMSIQNILVAVLILIIAVFATGGLANADWSHFTPMFPIGVGPVIAAAVSTYYAFAGMNVVIELSGEMKNPGRNAIRMIMVGLVTITVLYLGVAVAAVAAVALVQPSELGVEAPIVYAASMVFPDWFGGVVALGAVAACWTTLNAVMAALGRQLFGLSRSRILPQALSKLNKAGTPYIAMVSLTLVGILITIFSEDVMKFVNLSGTYLLLTSITIAVSSLRIQKTLPEMYNRADFKLRGFWYYFWPIGAIVTSIFFLVLAIMDDPQMSLLSFILIPLGLGIYVWRASIVKRTGTSVEELLKVAISEEGATAETSEDAIVKVQLKETEFRK
ncbi:APC family permease [Enteractinococcus coprophilus]|nr:APC family permease [Enteractinococcus coprophilus]